MEIPLLSVIIPCYNQGPTLLELIDCFKGYQNQTVYEIIIVNDGSQDPYTLETLTKISEKGITVIHQENQKLCATRNTGIRHAKGKYIYPIDGDDLIDISFFEEALTILESSPQYDVVYCDGQYFGMKEGIWRIGDFNLQRLMLWNYIPSCAMYRKSVWEKANGYDHDILGLEDWDFWLSVAFNGGKFYYINRVYFKYRIQPFSMSQSLTEQHQQELFQRIQEKHKNYFGRAYLSDDFTKRFKVNKKLWVKLFIRIYFPKYFQKLLKEGKIKNPNLD